MLLFKLDLNFLTLRNVRIFQKIFVSVYLCVTIYTYQIGMAVWFEGNLFNSRNTVFRILFQYFISCVKKS